MALRISVVSQTYRCTQEELYAAALLIMDSFDANQSFFQTKKTTYTAAFGSALRAEILAARSLPDYQQRGTVPESFRVHMLDAATSCLALWRELDSLIRDAFPKNQFKPLREAAGSTKYIDALRNDWESLSQLMQSGSTFIANHTTALTAGGMIASFQTTFNTARENFDPLYQSFKGAEQTTTEQREQKIIANNTFYHKIVNLCDDGKKYFRLNPAKRARFTITKVLELVSATHTQPKEELV